MACTGLNALNPICQAQEVPRQLTRDAFSQIAGWFGQAASSAVRGLWASIDSATTIDLDSPQLATDLVATSAIAGVLCLGLFAIQVITSLLRREPGGLARALRGLFVALVASAFALTAKGAFPDAPVELHDAVTLRYEGGAIGTMSGASCHFGAYGNKAAA